jgi:hypothetical protein
MDHALNELQRLYDSEVNFAIETLWDKGFTVRIGDKRNGDKTSTTVKTIEEAVAWLRQQARVFFPNSDYVLNLPH